MSRILLPRLVFSIFFGGAFASENIFAERSPDILLSAVSGMNLVTEYEDIHKWSDQNEEIVKLYLDERNQWTHEEKLSNRKGEDEYYLEGWNQASDTLKLTYFCFMIVGGIILILSVIVLFFNERAHAILHLVR